MGSCAVLNTTRRFQACLFVDLDHASIDKRTRRRIGDIETCENGLKGKSKRMVRLSCYSQDAVSSNDKLVLPLQCLAIQAYPTYSQLAFIVFGQ
jgi:hypothetical protein